MAQSTDQSIGPVLTRLSETIRSRRADDPNKSYTASLLSSGAEKCASKFGEEAVETIIAGVSNDKKTLTSEAADALYHLLVLLEANEVSLDAVAAELTRREGTSGHDEKASR